MKKETPKEVQLRISKLKWFKVKAVKFAGHPNDIACKCIKALADRSKELAIPYKDKSSKSRVWPGTKSSFQIVVGESYQVREDFLTRVDWFEASKNKDK